MANAEEAAQMLCPASVDHQQGYAVPATLMEGVNMEHSLLPKDVRWQAMREHVGSRASPPRQVCSSSSTQFRNNLACNAAIGKGQRSRAGTPTRLAPPSDSPSSRYRPRQAQGRGLAHAGRPCDSACSTPCPSSPEDLDVPCNEAGYEDVHGSAAGLPPGALQLEEFEDCSTPLQAVTGSYTPSSHEQAVTDSYTPSRHEQAVTGTYTPSRHEQAARAAGDVSAMKELSMSAARSSQDPSQHDSEDLEMMTHQPARGQSACTDIGIKGSGMNPKRAAAQVVAITRPMMHRAALNMQQITGNRSVLSCHVSLSPEPKGLGAEEQAQQILAMRLLNCMDQGGDIRSLLESVVAPRAESSRCSLGAASAVSSAHQPSQFAAAAACEPPPEPPAAAAWPSAEAQVAYRSSWIPAEFGSGRNSLLNPRFSFGPGLPGHPGTGTGMLAVAPSADPSLNPSQLWLQQQDQEQAEMGEEMLSLLRFPSLSLLRCPSVTCWESQLAQAFASPRERTGCTAAAEDSGSSGPTAAAASAHVQLLSAPSQRLPSELMLDEGEDRELGHLLDILDPDTFQAEDGSRNPSTGPSWSAPGGLHQAAAKRPMSYTRLPSIGPDLDLDLGGPWQLPQEAPKAAVNSSAAQLAPAQPLALSLPVGRSHHDDSRALELDTPAASEAAKPRGKKKAAAAAAAAAAAPQEWSVSPAWQTAGSFRGAQPAGCDVDLPDSSDAEPGMMEGMMMLTTANGDKRMISKEMLVRVYHLPINAAAHNLGMGVTVLKKYCRQFKVGRWPFRKLTSIDKLIETITQETKDSPERSATAMCLLRELAQCREEIYADPMYEIPESIKRLRQANFKNVYKHRHAGRRSKAEEEGEGDWGEEDAEMKDD